MYVYVCPVDLELAEATTYVQLARVSLARSPLAYERMCMYSFVQWQGENAVVYTVTLAYRNVKGHDECPTILGWTIARCRPPSAGWYIRIILILIFIDALG